MPQEIDDRLVALTIVSVVTDPNTGATTTTSNTYTQLYIYASGTKYANSLQNEAEIMIANLTEETRNQILTNATPFTDPNRQSTAILSAGRVSYGLSEIYRGTIVSAQPTQPPDIVITLRCLTANYFKGLVVARNQPSATSLKNISQQIASDLGVSLVFEADDKQITNYTYTGPVLNQVVNLNTMSEVYAYIDGDKLVVQNAAVPLQNSLKIVNVDTGMIGIPTQTELGAQVIMLIDNFVVLGGSMKVSSTLNPAVNGLYVIYQLSFEISNREAPFYWIAEGIRVTT